MILDRAPQMINFPYECRSSPKIGSDYWFSMNKELCWSIKSFSLISDFKVWMMTCAPKDIRITIIVHMCQVIRIFQGLRDCLLIIDFGYCTQFLCERNTLIMMDLEYSYCRASSQQPPRRTGNTCTISLQFPCYRSLQNWYDSFFYKQSALGVPSLTCTSYLDFEKMHVRQTVWPFCSYDLNDFDCHISTQYLLGHSGTHAVKWYLFKWI